MSRNERASGCSVRSPEAVPEQRQRERPFTPGCEGAGGRRVYVPWRSFWYTATVRSATLRCVNSRSARARPSAPRTRRRPTSCWRVRKWERRVDQSSSGKTRPASPITCGISPELDPTNGTAHAIASISTRPNCSRQFEALRDGNTNASRLCITPGTSVDPTSPRNWTRSPSPSA